MDEFDYEILFHNLHQNICIGIGLKTFNIYCLSSFPIHLINNNLFPSH